MTEGITVVALDPTRWTMHPPRVAEGVLGYTHMIGNDLWIMLLIGDPHGQGHVGAYLDACCLGVKAFKDSPGRVIVVESLNEILQGMLERRGFKPRRTQMPPPINDVVDVMVYG